MTAVAVWRRVRTVSHSSYNEIRLAVAARPLPASSVGLIPEVIVTLGKRTTAPAVIAAAILLLPGLAQAQRQATSRQAVTRPVPARPVYGGGVYRGPAVYRPYYASPYWYGGYYPYYGYGYPFAFSVGFGCCGYPYYGYPYYGYPYGYAYDNSASLRLQVSPREAEVFIDGYYAGTVDDFDGTFQRLHVEPGDHELELFMPGHRSYQQKVYLQPERHSTYVTRWSSSGQAMSNPCDLPAGLDLLVSLHRSPGAMSRTGREKASRARQARKKIRNGHLNEVRDRSSVRSHYACSQATRASRSMVSRGRTPGTTNGSSFSLDPAFTTCRFARTGIGPT